MKRHKKRHRHVKIYITRHFQEQWRERINGNDNISKMLMALRYAMFSSPAKRLQGEYYLLQVRGTAAVLALTDKGWVAVTVLPTGCRERRENTTKRSGEHEEI